MSSPVDNHWLKIPQVAAEINMKETYVRDLIDAGLLIAYAHTAGTGQRKHYRIHRHDLAKFLESRRTDQLVADSLKRPGSASASQ
jgi:hypothetical protein